MRVERLDETVGCVACFEPGRLTPLVLQRGEREEPVLRVHARWLDRSQRHPQHYFSVEVASGEIFELRLDTGDLSWRLQSVLLEG